MRAAWILIPLLATLGCRTMRNDSFAPQAVMTYKKIGDTELKLHVFNPAPGPSPQQLPAIVFFFGGGWRKGHPQQFYPQCAYLSSRGMVAISAEYRVERVHGTTLRECVEDAKSAVRWIRQHAAELGVDPERVAAGGGSAGGHIAAVAGLTDELNAPNEDPAISSRPDALVLFNPVVDISKAASSRGHGEAFWGQISPIDNVDEKTPPTIFFLGTEDRVIPVSQAEAFQRRVESEGGRCDLHLYESQVHGFFNYHRSREFFVVTMTETDRFLQSLGFLPDFSNVDVDAWLEKRR